MPKGNKNKTKTSTPAKGATPTMKQVETQAKKAVSKAIAEMQQSKPKPKKSSASGSSSGGISTLAMPASVGTTMKGVKPTIRADGGRITITGREFITTLPENNQSNWYLGALFPIHPAYFKSTVLSNYSRSYEFYKFNGGKVHFITRQPTSATGEVLMYEIADNTTTSFSYNATDFLAGAFSLENSVLGPIWGNHTLHLKPGRGEGLTNPLMDVDINDNLKGEVAVLTQSGVTDTAGFILFDYSFTFYSPLYSLHQTYLPVNTGPYDLKSFADVSNEAANAPMQLTVDAEFASNLISNGAVFKVVLNSTGTSYAAGTSATTALRIANGSLLSDITVQDGTTFYACVIGSAMVFYPTLVAAKEQSSTIYVAYKNTVAAKTTWSFICYLVQLGSYANINQN